MEALRLQEVVVFLATAGLLIPLAKRFRVSPTLGFLTVGLLVGPYGLGRLAETVPWLHHALLTDVDGVRALAELGVVFLLFTIGLELSIGRVWSMRRLVLGLGGGQILLTAALIGLIAFVFDNSLPASIVLGSCLALSSTAVVMQLLIEQGRFGTAMGHGSFAILLAQDLAVVPILFVVGALGIGEGSVGVALALALGKAVVAVAAILLLGRLVVRPLFRFVSESRSAEWFLATTLLVVIATATLTHAAGLSGALGAFLVGLLLADTEFRHEIEVNIAPFKGLLLGLFFMSVGMSIDPLAVMTDPVWLALSIAGLILIKTVLTGALARAFGFSPGQSVEIGLGLAQGGEFAFVVIGMATSLAVLAADTAQFMLLVVSATLFLTPGTMRLAQAVGEALDSRRPAGDRTVELAPDVEGHVVIVGYGRTGALIAELLALEGFEHVAVDTDPSKVGAGRARGAPVFLGDASRFTILGQIRLPAAAALVVTIDDAGATERVVRAARESGFENPIVVRARDRAHGRDLRAAGASHVVHEVMEAGLKIGHHTLEHLGIPPVDALKIVNDHRERSERHFHASEPSD